jgi:hypothetical protein
VIALYVCEIYKMEWMSIVMRSEMREISFKRLLPDLLIFSAVPLLALLISSPIFNSDEDKKAVEDISHNRLVTTTTGHQLGAIEP